jgi:plastocyanin
MRRLALVLTLGVLGVAGCGRDDDADDGSARESPAAEETRPAESGNGAAVVEMNDQLAFQPKRIEVSAGEKVTWKNVGKVAHTVTADKSKAANPSLVSVPAGTMEWDSGFVAEGESISRTFRKPGTYRYICIPHEGAAMVGSVVVKEDRG